jgi:beta-glucosidase
VIDGAALARQIASCSAVLAANPQGLLPLDPTAISTVAVIGALAMDARVLGGGSATVFPAHAVSPLEGLTTALPDSVKLTFAVGADVHTDMLAEAKPPQWSGLRATFRDSAGQAVHATALATGAGRWLQLPDGVDASMLSSVEISGRLRAEVGGTHQLRIRGIGDFVLTAAGQLVFDGRLRPATEDIATSLFSPPEHRIAVDLAAGSVTDVPLLHQVVFAPGFTAVPPNTQLKYCNLGYQLLGEIVGRAASAHHQPPRRVPGAVHHRRLLRHRRGHCRAAGALGPLTGVDRLAR